MLDKYDFSVIRTLRKRKGMTIQELAERSELTYPTIESIEVGKTLPSLKTIDALADAFGILPSNLLSLCEKITIIHRSAQFIENLDDPTQVGSEKCKIAAYDDAKLIRIQARKNEKVQVMKIHKDVYEFCFVLSGALELTINNKTYELEKDETVLFDGLQEHSYRQIEDGEYLTLHVPKKSLSLQRLLREGAALREEVACLSG